MRGGIHLVQYLDPGHYFGIDRNAMLIDVGYEKEIKRLGLETRLPKSNLVANDRFDATGFMTSFDFAIAFSLFTHLPLDLIRVCLERISGVLRPRGTLYATFFELPAGKPTWVDVHHEPGEIITHAGHDPFHQRPGDFRHLAAGLDLDVTLIGDFEHPRGQRLVAFTKGGDGVPVSAERGLPVYEAERLPAGADHYRAYVGPPERYDLIGASQFALLFQFGLRETHKVLDFGCGSLRLGRLLIPFLREGCYFGIDPNLWLIDEGLDRELGRSAQDLKRPRFSDDPNFDCTIFAETFDYIIAQSIVTHTGPDLAARLFASVAKALGERGLFLFSYIRANDASPLPPGGWHYPHCVGYGPQQLDAMLTAAGLVAMPLPWYHPGASWHVAARNPQALPSSERLSYVTGEVVHALR